MIDIRNFVNINIERLQNITDSGTRPQVVVYGYKDSETGSTTDVTYVGSSSDYKKFYKAGTDEPLDITGKEFENYKPLEKYLSIFFQNGGVEVTFTSKSLADILSDANKKNYLNNIVLVPYNGTVEGTVEINTDTLNEQKGIYQKIIVERSSSAPASLSNSFIAVKVSKVIGAEMTIAAYLSKMKVYEDVSDYDFTEEYGLNEDLSNELNYENEGSSLSAIPYNFEMQIGNRYLNVGGNTTDGESLVEQYATIVLTQTVTEKVFNALSAKLVGQSGMAAIRTAISAELDKYVNSGFLTTDKVWMNEDLIVPNNVRKGESEVVITKNTPISTGYYIHLFKLSKDGRNAYVFILLPTTKGIRYVQIDGRIM